MPDLDLTLELDLTLPLDRFALRVEARLGPSTAILGPSGAGKTSLLESIAGLRSASGRIVLNGEVLQDFEHFRPPELRHLGFVPQSGALFPHLSVRSNLLFGQSSTGRKQPSAAVDEIAQRLGLTGLLDRYPRHLSGGETKRVALGRALLAAPRLLLLDEPTAGLDPLAARRALSQVRSVCAQSEIPLLVVTHRPDEALALADEVLWLKDGQVQGHGPARRILRRLQAEHHESAVDLGEESLVEGTIAAHSQTGGVTHVVLEGGNRLSVPYSPDVGIGEWVLLAIGADEVLVARQRPDGLSARNAVEVAVDELVVQDRTILLRAGNWFARLTPEAVGELGLEVGGIVWLVVKTHSWRIVAAGRQLEPEP